MFDSEKRLQSRPGVFGGDDVGQRELKSLSHEIRRTVRNFAACDSDLFT